MGYAVCCYGRVRDDEVITQLAPTTMKLGVRLFPGNQ